MGIGKGTTATVTYGLTTNISSFPVVWFTLEDSVGYQINLDKERITFSTIDNGVYGVSVKLTQTEALSLANGTVKVQIRAKDNEGNTYQTDVAYTKTVDILMEGEI